MSSRKAGASKLVPSRTRAHRNGGNTQANAGSAHHGSGPLSKTISTNLSAYSRTDPFHSFNTLQKLLTSLSSRPASNGTHLKLTQDEHNLSLHLLKIIEPFISSTPSSRTLITRQPTEILDAIVFHVDDKEDLRRLARTCWRMYDVIVPRHLGYRIVKAKASSLAVWNHFITNKALAKNVRQVEIIDERSPPNSLLIPSGIHLTDTDLESTDDELDMRRKQEKLLVSALGRMTHLQSFKWNANASATGGLGISEVWDVLKRIGTLKDVDVADWMMFHSPEILHEEESSESEREGVQQEKRKEEKRPVVLSELHSMSVRSNRQTFPQGKTPTLARLKSMLNHAPNLTTLAITFPLPRSTGPTATNAPQILPDLTSLFLYTRFPLLTSLTLSNLTLRCASGSEAAATFFAAHPKIEVLNLGSGTLGGVLGWKIDLIDGSLPALRELSASAEFIGTLLSCPCAASGYSSTSLATFSSRPLEAIRGPVLTTSIAASAHTPYASIKASTHFLASLKAYGGSVKRIELSGWGDIDDIRRLAECSPPSLSWLDVGKRLTGHNHFHSADSTGPGGASAVVQDVSTRGEFGRELKKKQSAPMVNVVEWATLLSAFPSLTTFHGVRFFYEVSEKVISSSGAGGGIGVASSTTGHGGEAAGTIATLSSAGIAGGIITMADRSRIRKNDEVASMLAWKCKHLRRVDHWEGGGGKVVCIVREGHAHVSANGVHITGSTGGGEPGAKEKERDRDGREKVRWEVRRVQKAPTSFGLVL